MANIVVNSDANCIMVDFGIYASIPDVNTDKTIYPRRMIAQVSKPYQQNFVMVLMGIGGSNQEWHLSYESVPEDPSTLIIDSVNGTVPADLDELYTLLGGLIVA